MKRFIHPLLIVVLLSSVSGVTAQYVKKQVITGVNLASLIARTVDLKVEYHIRPQFSYQLGAGIMHKNTRPGSLKKISDGTHSLENSGAFLSFGGRVSTRNQLEKSALFIGAKVISGYFEQQGLLYDEDPQNTRNSMPLNANGYFTALGLETGATIRLAKRFFMDIGLQYSPVFYKDRQVSNYFSVLPGIGAIGNLQGVLTLKYAVFQRSE